MRSLSILSFFLFVTISKAQKCFRKGADPKTCRSCSWNAYQPERLYEEETEFEDKECLPKNELSSSSRTILITRLNCGVCAEMFQAVYSDLNDAFIKESLISQSFLVSRLEVFLAGNSTVLGTVAEGIGYFRRILMNVTLSPLLCEKLKVDGCFASASLNAKIILTSLNFSFFVSLSLRVERIDFSTSAELYGESCACPNEASSCWLSGFTQFAPDSILHEKRGAFNLEILYDYPSAPIPRLEMINCSFKNMFTLTSYQTDSLINIKQQGASIYLLNINISGSFFLGGFVVYRPPGYSAEEVEFPNEYFFKLNHTNSSYIATIKELYIEDYNCFFMKNSGKGGRGLFDFEGWEGKKEIRNLSISNMNSNHNEQYLFIFVQSQDTLITYLQARKVFNLLLLFGLESTINIQQSSISFFAASNSSSVFLLSESQIYLEGFQLSDYTQPFSRGFGAIEGEGGVVKIDGSSLTRCSSLMIVMREGDVSISNSSFLNVSFNYALVSAQNSDLAILNSAFVNISGAFWVFETVGAKAEISHVVGIGFASEAAVNFEACEWQKLISCVFSKMSGIKSFWSSSRAFKVQIVEDCVIRESAFDVLYSYYTDSNVEPSITFSNVRLENLIVLNMLFEYCCTNFSLLNSTVENVFMDEKGAKALGCFEVDKNFLIAGSVFRNVGWLEYPHDPIDLTLILFRGLFSLWFTSSFRMINCSFVNTIRIYIPTGIVIVADFDKSIYLSDILVDLKGDKNIVKFGIICYATDIIMQNCVVKNAGCPESSKNLTFFHEHGTIGFFNFPQYGGERANKKKIVMKNNSFFSCHCVNGGSLAFVNYNYLSIENCSFFGSAAEINGGTLLIVSSNEVNLSNIYISHTKASYGGGYFLLSVDSLTLVQGTIFESSSENEAGLAFISQALQANLVFCYFKNSQAAAKGGLYVENTFLKVIMAQFENLSSSSGGAIYVSFGSSVVAGGIRGVNCKANSGGVLFGEESRVFFILSASFINCSAASVSSAIHLKSFKSFFLLDVRMTSCLTNLKGGIYVKTNEERPVAYIERFLCDSPSGDQGVCLLYEASGPLILKNASVVNARSGTLFEFNQPTTIDVFIKDLKILKSFTSSLMKGRSMRLHLELLWIERNEIETCGFQLIQSQVLIYSASFIDNDHRTCNEEAYFFCGEENYLDSLELRLEFVNSRAIGFFSSHTQTSLNMNETFLNGYMSCIELPLIVLSSGSINLNSFHASNTNQSMLALADTNASIFNFTLLNSSSPVDFSSLFTTERDSSFLVTNFLSLGKVHGLLFSTTSVANVAFISVFVNVSRTRLPAIIDEATTNRFLELLFCESFKLLDSILINMFASTGAGILIKSKDEEGGSAALLKNNLFERLKGNLGSVFYAQGSITVSMAFNIFRLCSADHGKTASKSGIGGVAFIKRAKYTTLALLSNAFDRNSAASYAPTIFCENRITLCSDNTFLENKDSIAFTANLSSYPIKFRYANGSANQTKTYLDVETERLIIVSGQLLNISIQMFDFFGNRIIFDDFSSATLTLDVGAQENSGDIIIDKNSAGARQGLFEFREFKIKATPNQNFSLLLSVNLLEERCCETNEETLKQAQQINQRILAFSRPCIVGEIKTLDSTCRPCPAGSFSLADPSIKKSPEDPQKCHPCPENARCEKDMIIPNKGFWKASKESTLILRCELPEACLGGLGDSPGSLTGTNSAGTCAIGHYGNICNDCEIGYGKISPGALCQDCKKESILLILRGLILGVFASVYIILSAKVFSRVKENSLGASFASLLFKILLNHFHQVSVVTFMEKISIIPSLEFFINLQKLASFLNQDFLAVECLMDGLEGYKEAIYVYKVLAVLVLPIVLGLISSFFWILLFLTLLLFLPEKKGAGHETIKKILIGFAISIYVFYPLIIQSCFSLLNCIYIDDTRSSSFFLFIAPNMACWDARHIMYLLTVFLPGILMIGLFFPIFMLVSLRMARKFQGKQLKSPRRKSLAIFVRAKIVYLFLLKENIFGFFDVGYRNEFYYWEGVIFFRKFTLTMLSSLNQLIKPQTKNILVLITLFISYSWSLKCQAFKDPKANWLEQLSLLSTIITCMCMVFIGGLEDKDWRVSFAAVTILVNAAFILFVLLFIVGALRNKFRVDKQARKSDIKVLGKSPLSFFPIARNLEQDL